MTFHVKVNLQLTQANAIVTPHETKQKIDLKRVKSGGWHNEVMMKVMNMTAHGFVCETSPTKGYIPHLCRKSMWMSVPNEPNFMKPEKWT